MENLKTDAASVAEPRYIISGSNSGDIYHDKWRPVEERVNIGGNLMTSSCDWAEK